MPGIRYVAAAAGLTFIAFAAVLFGGRGFSLPVNAFDDVTLTVIAMVAASACALAGRANVGRQRAGWCAIAVGVLAWTLGQGIWSYQDIVLGGSVFPSVADIFYMTFPVGAGIALLLFWNRRGGRLKGRVLLDGLIVAGSLFMVAWLLPMSRLYESDSESRLAFAVALAYPAFDIVLLTIAASVLINAPEQQRFPLTLLTVGLVFMSAADSGYAFLEVREEYLGANLIDLGWLAGLLLITVAAAAARTPTNDEPALDEIPGWTSVWLPYLPLMVAGGALAASPVASSSSRLIIGIGLVLTAAVLTRQYLVVDSNRRLIAAVADQALRDPLTGLANRTLFADRLGRALRTPGADDVPVGVLMIDLDDFKLINDTLGHGAGDQLLIGTAERITASVRAEDVVARLGGDEFAVMIQAPAPLLENLANRLVDAFRKPIVIDGHALVMHPSVGLAFTGPGEPDLSADKLLDRADVAMYSAKRNNDVSLRIYTDDLQHELGPGPDGAPADGQPPDGAAETLNTTRQLRRALRAGDLALVYQPMVDLATGAAVGLEALLRWPHPDRGVLGPEEFLPLVRRYGLTDAVTDFVLDRALADAVAWRSQGIDLPVAVNIFPWSPSTPDLPAQIDRALESRGLDPTALTVEITEDGAAGDLDSVRELLLELRARGIRVAVDGFGSGSAPLRYLRDLPVDAVKLDRELIVPIATDPRCAAVVLGVIDLARILGIATVAEGVEDAATANVLRRFDCDLAQGYLFSAPLALAELLKSSLLQTSPGDPVPVVHLN